MGVVFDVEQVVGGRRMRVWMVGDISMKRGRIRVMRLERWRVRMM